MTFSFVQTSAMCLTPPFEIAISQCSLPKTNFRFLCHYGDGEEVYIVLGLHAEKIGRKEERYKAADVALPLWGTVEYPSLLQTG
jgi:hypothetical protein